MPNPLTTTPANLLGVAYETYGLCEISCDCGGWAMAVDADMNLNDISKARDLIDHARHDHVSPRRIVATIHRAILDLGIAAGSQFEVAK